MPPTASSSATTHAVASPTTTAKPTPTVDPVIAKIPAAARPETIEGAAAFAKFYFEQVNEAFRDSQTRRLAGAMPVPPARCARFASTEA